MVARPSGSAGSNYSNFCNLLGKKIQQLAAIAMTAVVSTESCVQPALW